MAVPEYRRHDRDYAVTTHCRAEDGPGLPSTLRPPAVFLTPPYLRIKGWSKNRQFLGRWSSDRPARKSSVPRGNCTSRRDIHRTLKPLCPQRASACRVTEAVPVKLVPATTHAMKLAKLLTETWLNKFVRARVCVCVCESVFVCVCDICL
jgi:hypothetical protein